MKRIIYLTLFLTYLTPQASQAQIRLTTPSSSFSIIAGVQNYAAIIVEGASAGSQAVELSNGPGQVYFDKAIQRWLWSWQPSLADTGRELEVVIRAAAASNQCKFKIRPQVFRNDNRLHDLSKGRFYSGIPSNINAKQPGMDGAYQLTLRFDDSIAMQVSEPSLSIRPHMHKEIDKTARLDVQYTAPMTGKAVTLASYQTKVKYPPFRVVPSIEVNAGEAISFKGALGLAPNYYAPVPSPFLIVRSNRYLADTAFMVMAYSSEEGDPFSVFAIDPKTRTSRKATNSFEFMIQQTEKSKAISEMHGKVIPVELYDPVSKQTTHIELRIYPVKATTEN